MSEYSIGIEDHYAWANLLTVTTVGVEERLVDRRRVELLDRPLPASPYHRESLDLPPREGDDLVRRVRASAGRCARSALATLIAELGPATCRGVAIRLPPLERLPETIADARASAAITNRADGMIYHQALTEAAGQLGLRVLHFDRTTILARAAEARETPAQEFERRLKEFGRTLGPPWRRGHIIACAGAIWAHVSARSLQPETP
jgi:hypothetical protein